MSCTLPYLYFFFSYKFRCLQMPSTLVARILPAISVFHRAGSDIYIFPWSFMPEVTDECTSAWGLICHPLFLWKIDTQFTKWLNTQQKLTDAFLFPHRMSYPGYPPSGYPAFPGYPVSNSLSIVWHLLGSVCFQDWLDRVNIDRDWLDGFWWLLWSTSKRPQSRIWMSTPLCNKNYSVNTVCVVLLLF